jgi:hypothetical protein
MRHTAIYDPARDRLIIFGGYSDGPLNDTWALSLDDTPTWSELTPGSGIATRAGASAIYDPVGDRMIIFGGESSSQPTNEPFANPWQLDLSGVPTWSAINAGGVQPTGRAEHVSIYDPVGHRMIIQGGNRAGACKRDTWALPLAAGSQWQSLPDFPGFPDLEGRSRYTHSAVYDPYENRMLVFGGVRSAGSFCVGGGVLVNDVWALSLGGAVWNQIVPVRIVPPARRRHSAIFDPIASRMIVFGGVSGLPRRDTWMLSLGSRPTWVELLPPPPEPSPRSGHAVVLDPVRRRLMVFGGEDGRLRNDTWSLGLSGVPGWSLVEPAGEPPAARSGHSAIHDSPRDRILVFGGSDGTVRNDLWSLSLAATSTWTQLATAGSPPPARQWHTSIHDPVRDRMIVFGGGGDATRRNDVWVLSLAGIGVWTELSTSGLPPTGRLRHSAIYDPLGDRMLVFGGNDGADRGDAWSLSLGTSPTWSELGMTGTPPAARSGHVAAYDARFHRMIVFSGYAGTRYKNDAWALSLDAGLTWTRPTTGSLLPALRSQAAGVLDASGDRMVIFGGKATTRLNDTWALDWSGAAVAFDPLGGGESGEALADRAGADIGPLEILAHSVRPVPTRRTLEMSFLLRAPAEVTLRILDVQGREVTPPLLIAGVQGANHLTLTLASGDRPIQRGVYFYVLQSRNDPEVASARGRFVLLP